MIPTKAHVLRDGRIIDVNVEDVVLGDIVEISGGDKVPADLRIISARGLKSKNVAMFSTSVLEGSARGVVILTSDNTVVGRIAALTAQVSSGSTPIAREINYFINIVTFVAVGIGVTFFVLAFVYGYTLIQALLYFMGIIVAEAPEAIVATVTVSIHQNGDRFLLVMKGAAEKILKACSSTLIGGEEAAKDKKFEEDFKKAYEQLGGFGERVLGFCDLELDPEKFPKTFVFNTDTPNFPLTNLRFLGFMAMIDPPRPGVPQAVRLCQSAGITVILDSSMRDCL
ncbi:unnamed protein product [Strongylus vulgaris]|uniref:P-type ATPase A domain-containing protein n=1 Tax=Strongylus vulgaris TaxID=40348 RepID=A0A3P7J4N2_STRVU|nr:unnamed protein product [Strongylus vulgaris]